MHADVFRAISEPTRRAILDRLAAGELASGTIAAQFAMTPGAVSQHLKVLRDAGLVQVRREGRGRYYRLSPERLREVHDWVAHYQAFWEHGLDRFGELLDGAHQDAP